VFEDYIGKGRARSDRPPGGLPIEPASPLEKFNNHDVAEHL